MTTISENFFDHFWPNHYELQKILKCILFQMGGNIYDAEWLEFVIPSEKHSSNFLDAKNKYDGCEMYKSLNSIKSPSAIS